MFLLPPMFYRILRRLLRPYIALRDRYVERQLDSLSEEQRFALIYKSGYWKGVGAGSLSGEGSSLVATEKIRKALPGLLVRLNIRSMLDVPCGDWFWMSKVELGGVDYVGGDIVDELVQMNQRQHGQRARQFRKINLIEDDLPRVDLVFVRDCLVHLEPAQIQQCVRNVVKSGATYFATTTFSDVLENTPPVLKDRWRPLNMMLPPYSFPTPVELLDDSWADNPADRYKCLGVWRVSDLAALFPMQSAQQARDQD